MIKDKWLNDRAGALLGLKEQPRAFKIGFNLIALFRALRMTIRGETHRAPVRVRKL
jgi:hypothetical protein